MKNPLLTLMSFQTCMHFFLMTFQTALLDSRVYLIHSVISMNSSNSNSIFPKINCANNGRDDLLTFYFLLFPVLCSLCVLRCIRAFDSLLVITVNTIQKHSMIKFVQFTTKIKQ